MARQLARNVGASFKDGGCAGRLVSAPVGDPFPQRLEKQVRGGRRPHAVDAVHRLTQISADKERIVPSVAEVRRELSQKLLAEYAKQWWHRQPRMTANSMGEGPSPVMVDHASSITRRA
ncbi:hypothetical protein ACF1FC_32015 [Streptomyces sp. NPDC014344]|uniref:hypothetical protein n=1 Tax=Streptomyces sp. NPDC014344 TaxID=3364871 RepID=UPI0036F7222E